MVRQLAVTTDTDSAAILAGMTAELRKENEIISTMVETKRHNDGWWYWKLGKHLVVMEERELAYREKHSGEERNSLYGTQFFKQLSDYNDINVGTMYKSMRLYVVYSDKADFEQLMACRTAKGRALSFTHCLAIAEIKDASDRQQVLSACLAECWTTDALAEQIRRLFGNPARRGSGRPTTMPKSFDGAITSMTSILRKVQQLGSDVWFGKRFDIREKLREIPAERLDTALYDRLQDALAMAETVNQETGEYCQYLQRMVAEVDERRRTVASAALDEDPDLVPLARPTEKHKSKQKSRETAGAR